MPRQHAKGPRKPLAPLGAPSLVSAGTEKEVGFAGKVRVMEAETITKAMD